MSLGQEHSLAFGASILFEVDGVDSFYAIKVKLVCFQEIGAKSFTGSVWACVGRCRDVQDRGNCGTHKACCIFKGRQSCLFTHPTHCQLLDIIDEDQDPENGDLTAADVAALDKADLDKHAAGAGDGDGDGDGEGKSTDDDDSGAEQGEDLSTDSTSL